MPRNLPPLRLLTVFDEVLRQRGIRPAAAVLNVSEPAVSQALRQLEAHVGAVLLDRSTRPAGLTQAGRLLHRAVVEGLGRIAEAVADIERLREGAGRSVTIACSVGFATYWLMPRLAGLYGSHPEVAVNVRTTPHGDPHFAEGVDIAVRYGAGDWPDGSVHRLFAERIEPVCSPPLAASGAGLEGASLIHVDVEDERWTPWSAYLKATGVRAGGRRPGLRFTNYVQATQAALAGQGVMLGWRSITADLVREGRLVPAAAPPLEPGDGFWFVTAPRPRSPEACRLVAEWLESEAAAFMAIEAE